MRSAWTSSILDEAKPPISAARTLPRIGSRLRRKDQRFAHRLHVQSDDYLIDHLGRLTVADSTGMGNILTHHFKKRSDARESLFGPPYMMYKVAFLAPTSPPDTGAST